MRNLLIIIFLIVVALISCEISEDNKLLNCNQLKIGVINSDRTILQTEFSKITNDLIPKLSTEDPFGHSANLDTLIARLNNCYNINAEIRCYACIKTLPPQSEIIIKVDSSGTQIQRIIDILTPEDNYLRFCGIHL